MRPRGKLEFVEIERPANQMATMSVRSQIFQLRLELSIVENPTETQRHRTCAPGVQLLFTFKQESHAVDPDQLAVQLAKPRSMDQELGIAKADDDGTGQIFDGFKLIGLDVVRHAANSNRLSAATRALVAQVGIRCTSTSNSSTVSSCAKAQCRHHQCLQEIQSQISSFQADSFIKWGCPNERLQATLAEPLEPLELLPYCRWTDCWIGLCWAVNATRFPDCYLAGTAARRTGARTAAAANCWMVPALGSILLECPDELSEYELLERMKRIHCWMNRPGNRNIRLRARIPSSLHRRKLHPSRQMETPRV